ncbi:hypothetical protein A8W25_28165 [Streptomyces sp. ERV7]|uniref:hypothetical protein n=1 Tax=Streptomyces sp. ERV7 TaxID=1322334 RepID=UPI0007F4D173|nr:hypothetical protein [Streptomyces sp. ERV7]OAR21922.1 hypothetical protein A8W25_28165 [Streptomyces sp. ERV7]
MPLDLLDRIRDLERRVHELTGRANIRPAMNEITHGAVRIGEGGSLSVTAPDGTGLFGVGQLPPFYNHTNGTPQQGLIIQREDGTEAITVRAIPSALGVDTQAVSVWDRSGNQVLSDETTTGWGMGTPYMPLVFNRLVSTGSDVVNDSNFQNRYFCVFPAQQPVAVVVVEFGAGGGSTCEVLLQYRTTDTTTWTDIGTASVTAAPTSTAWAAKQFVTPLHGAAYLLPCYFRLQVRQKSGTSGVMAHVLGAFTRATASKSEVPDPRPTSLARATAPQAAPSSTD